MNNACNKIVVAVSMTSDRITTCGEQQADELILLERQVCFYLLLIFTIIGMNKVIRKS